MMENIYGNMMGGTFGAGGFFIFLTWFALLVFLVLGSIYFWQKINKKK